MSDHNALTEKLAALKPFLDEKQWRLTLAAEARALGRGGASAVVRATGVSFKTVARGIRELSEGIAPDGRIRRPGAGRPSLAETQPGLGAALEGLVSPETRGDPMSPLRWTTKSLTKLRAGMTEKGFTISPNAIARLLKKQGYSLQGVKKTLEGESHVDRDAQFQHINAQAALFLAAGDPVISIDCKKKELVGEYHNKGREYQVKGSPVLVNGHDFPAGIPKAIPYGVYDVGADEGWVSVGVDHETTAFVKETILAWWEHLGAARYPYATRILITADAGGANGHRRRAWKVALAEIARATGLEITVCHYPPGTSKWNKIEHRLFSFVSINWRGRPLADYETIVSLIGATTTTSGLKVYARLDQGSYPTGLETSDAELAGVPLTKHEFHGEWNYTVSVPCGGTTAEDTKECGT